jgi:hypothetical protein
MNAARPLAPSQRDPFLQAVAQELRKAGASGPGAIYRICSELQKRFLLCAELDLRAHPQSKYR